MKKNRKLSHFSARGQLEEHTRRHPEQRKLAAAELAPSKLEKIAETRRAALKRRRIRKKEKEKAEDEESLEPSPPPPSKFDHRGPPPSGGGAGFGITA
jgi:hypothetical protein